MFVPCFLGNPFLLLPNTTLSSSSGDFENVCALFPEQSFLIVTKHYIEQYKWRL